MYRAPFVYKYTSDIFQKVLLDVLLHAVVDDDKKTVQIILNAYPELLLLKALQGIEIESQYTWLKIDAENEDALSIAAKRKQIKMIELLLPYYDKLEQTEEVIKAKLDALSAWKNYQTQKNEETGEDEIVIPQEYANYAQSLINVFKEETFPNSVKGKFSTKTEDALKLLFDILLPKQATKLDGYIDPELLLLALYTAYCNQFEAFQNWKQRDAFCMRMIGLAQSVLTPETAKIFCEGLYYVVEEKRKISERAESLKLLAGESFYRASRESLSGLGFEYLCGPAAARPGVARAGGMPWRLFEKQCRAKATNFRNITQQLQQQPHQHFADRKQSGCVIL